MQDTKAIQPHQQGITTLEISNNPMQEKQQQEKQQDELLAALLEQMLEASRIKGTQQLDEIIQQHPTLEKEIRELWATVTMAEEFGVFSHLSHGIGGTQIQKGGLPVTSHETTALPAQIGDYKIKRIIGRGGMGIVYHARQEALGRDVALKMLLQGHLATPDDVLRFGREAEAAAGLQHPNIVPVYEVGTHEGNSFFSMKYVEGKTLSERLTEGPLPPRDAATLLVPICRAIDEAHQQGLLHRDLKPSNILIDEQGHPYVSDFGLAKRIHSEHLVQNSTTHDNSITQTGAILGTPSYMAPEQAAGGSRGDIDKQADVYSLGALLYAMLTGHPPFQAASPVDIIMMVLEQDPVLPRVLNSKADADLEMIALKCLQKPRDLRYTSAGMLADDLECYLAGNPISARSSHFHQIISRLFRETHNATLLENWGLLWMLHAAVLVILTAMTNIFQFNGVTSRLPYMGLWIAGLAIWGGIFWKLRERSGPITFVERQIAHVWGGSVIVSSLLYAVESIMGLPVLSLSPALALVSGMVFLIKGGILTGSFYIQAAFLFATAIVMAWIQASSYPDFSISLFGFVSAASFFIPGLKYYLSKRKE